MDLIFRKFSMKKIVIVIFVVMVSIQFVHTTRVIYPVWDDAFEAFVVMYNKLYDSEDEQTYRRRIFEENARIVCEMNFEYELDLRWNDGVINKFADKKDFNKHYDENEEAVRRKAWEENMKVIHKHNKEHKRGLHNYTMGENEMTDWTHEEHRGHGACLLDTRFRESDSWHDGCDEECQRSLPQEFDWRDENVITGVKQQLRCGSCWAFAAVGAIEAHNALKTGRLIELSEQELIDCSAKYGNQGCHGGLASDAFDYVIANKGLNTEKNYPYEGKQSHCRKIRQKNKAAVQSYVILERNNEQKLKAVIARHGPVAAAIHSDMRLKFYKEGVFYNPDCPTNERDSWLNHEVLIVGYGALNGNSIWIVKNSWGPSWGMKGYVMVPRDLKSHCGIAAYTVLPMMSPY